MATMTEEEGGKSKRKTITPEALWKRVAHLDGETIGVTESCEKYNVNPGSLYRWIDKGYVRVLADRHHKGGAGKKRLLNEADIAYIAEVADIRGRQQGRTIITDAYIPPHAREHP